MHTKWMNTCIKTKVLTDCFCEGSGEEGVMEDVKRDICEHKVDRYMHKNKSTYFLLLCKYSGEKGVMEDIKRDKCVHKVDGHMHKNKSTY